MIKATKKQIDRIKEFEFDHHLTGCKKAFANSDSVTCELPNGETWVLYYNGNESIWDDVVNNDEE